MSGASAASIFTFDPPVQSAKAAVIEADGPAPPFGQSPDDVEQRTGEAAAAIDQSVGDFAAAGQLSAATRRLGSTEGGCSSRVPAAMPDFAALVRSAGKRVSWERHDATLPALKQLMTKPATQFASTTIAPVIWKTSKASFAPLLTARAKALHDAAASERFGDLQRRISGAPHDHAPAN
jgi:hypothetical protein